MIESGAERIGTSSGIKIVEDYKIFLHGENIDTLIIEGNETY